MNAYKTFFTSSAVREGWRCLSTNKIVAVAVIKCETFSCCLAVKGVVDVKFLHASLFVTFTATGVNVAGDAGDTSPPIFWLGGRQWEYPHQYYYVRLDIADQY